MLCEENVSWDTPQADSSTCPSSPLTPPPSFANSALEDKASSKVVSPSASRSSLTSIAADAADLGTSSTAGVVPFVVVVVVLVEGRGPASVVKLDFGATGSSEDGGGGGCVLAG